jgi:UDP-N-acetylglucosamine acyltransferase
MPVRRHASLTPLFDHARYRLVPPKSARPQRHRKIFELFQGEAIVSIHPLAVVSPHAEIGSHVRIGPFAIVEPGVVIGDRCDLAARVVVKTGTILGADNQVFEGAVIGGMPQHVHMPMHPGRVEIGGGNVIRENVTIHRALVAGHVTKIGSRCLLMVGSHVAHDCQLGDGVILTNNVMLAGHVTVGDRAYLSGGVAVHQYCNVGRLAMVGGMARVRQDVPPFVTIDGGSTMVVGLNKIGLRRAGFTVDEMRQLKAAYHLIYRSGLVWAEMLDLLAVEFPVGPASEFRPFFLAGKRGFVQERRTPPGAIVRLVRDDDADDSITLPAAEKKVG